VNLKSRSRVADWLDQSRTAIAYNELWLAINQPRRHLRWKKERS